MVIVLKIFCFNNFQILELNPIDSMLLKPNREICKEVGGSYQDENDCKCFYVCDLAYRPSRHCCPGLYLLRN
jgi:hypothetical protein